jgi:penicillin-binding protein 1A
VRAPKRRRIRKLRLVILLAVLGLLGLFSFTFGMIAAIASQIPALDPSRTQRLEQNGYIYASDGHTILSVLRGSQARVIVPSSQISPIMKQAIVAIEDKRFFEHKAIDLRGMARALWADLATGRVVQGGSTITQQFVKNAFVTDQQTIARKLKEAALAWQLEQRWSKDRILTAYLNTIYFGNGAYGIQQAAMTYFGHSASTLSLPEAALLAGIPADPSLYDPAENPATARSRRNEVLHQLYLQDDISRQDELAAESAPLPKPQDIHLPGTQGPAPYFVNYVKQLLVDRYGSSRVFGGGLRVTTSIDLSLQQLAMAAISKWLGNPYGPAAALVAIDPRDGRVLAMIGGRNYRHSQFNLAVQGERQPGSAFKPFVLATALSQGISPATTLVSKPQLIFLGNRYWSVHNFENSYMGPISLVTATAESDNTVYAQLTQLVGPGAVARMAHSLGITSPLQDYFAIGLGVEAVNPLEMARAFSSFANGGVRVDGSVFGDHPRAILDVQSPQGTQLNAPEGHRAISQVDAEVVNQLLQTVVTSGTGRKAALLDRPVAGKTGTTENYGDAWFVGYTPQLAVAVWVGYPNNLVPMTSEFQGGPVVGGSYPALIWRSFMETALPYLQDQPESFGSPPYLTQSSKTVVMRNGKLMLDNGYCRNTSQVVYFAGYGPPQTADCKKNEVDVPNVVGKTLADATARLQQMPLTPSVVYKPALPRQRLDIVLGQFPKNGTLSSFDKVTLVLAKPLHGVVPDVVGLDATVARTRLQGAHLQVSVRRVYHGRRGTVLSQSPPGGVAAAPGLGVTISIAASAPRQVAAGG